LLGLDFVGLVDTHRDIAAGAPVRRRFQRLHTSLSGRHTNGKLPLGGDQVGKPFRSCPSLLGMEKSATGKYAEFGGAEV